MPEPTRLTFDLDGVTHWIAFSKTRWTRKDLATWQDAMNASITQGDKPLLELLATWASELYIEDVDGQAYHTVAELTLDVLDQLDVPVYSFLTHAPFYAYQERSSLGKVGGSRL